MEYKVGGEIFIPFYFDELMKFPYLATIMLDFLLSSAMENSFLCCSLSNLSSVIENSSVVRMNALDFLLSSVVAMLHLSGFIRPIYSLRLAHHHRLSVRTRFTHKCRSNLIFFVHVQLCTGMVIVDTPFCTLFRFVLI